MQRKRGLEGAAAYGEQVYGENRLLWVDLFRGGGIIFMIMGHVWFGTSFDHFIHAFHMPMFFFVSGMFFKVKEGSFWDYTKRKMKSLLLPYVVFGSAYYLIWAAAKWKLGEAVSLKPLAALLFVNTDRLPIAGALWFLTALFFSNIIYYWLRTHIKKTAPCTIMIVAVALFGCLSTVIMPFRLPYALDAAFVGVGLMHIGMLTKAGMDHKGIQRILHLKWIEGLLLAAVTTILIFVNGYINMRTGTYAFIPLFWINVILSMILGINAAKQILKIRVGGGISRLAFIGRNSIVYLCMNEFVIIIIAGAADVFKLPFMISKALVLTLTMVILHILAFILLNTRLRKLVGKE